MGKDNTWTFEQTCLQTEKPTLSQHKMSLMFIDSFQLLDFLPMTDLVGVVQKFLHHCGLKADFKMMLNFSCLFDGTVTGSYKQN